jgi:hypothetical protein
MGSWRIFQHPAVRLKAGDAERRRIGVADAPVPQGRRHFVRKSVEISATKNPAGQTVGPYRKPTQVGQASIRRRSGEPS